MRPEHGTSLLTQRIHSRAAELGFALTGIAPAVTPTGYHRLLQWIADGYAGQMAWMERRQDAYRSPSGVLQGTRSVIVVALNYNAGRDVSSPGRISRYALGRLDYHDVLRKRLKELATTIHDAVPDVRTRVVVDTAPLLERDFARLAGIGWFGKNTMLISRQIGSWFFLGALLTDVELDYDDPCEQNWCGTCTRCLDACPTDAFPEAGVLDARRCISYLTIELRETAIPRDLRSGMKDWAFGCDICQDVCPWNRFAPADVVPELQPQEKLSQFDARRVLRMSPAQFDTEFQSTPLVRPGYNGMRRNAAIVLGNLGDTAAEAELSVALDDADPVLRGAAAWALGQLQTATSQKTLRSRLAIETDSGVVEEIEQAVSH